MVAARDGHAAVAKLLLDAGADRERADAGRGAAALHPAERVAAGPLEGHRHRPRRLARGPRQALPGRRAPRRRCSTRRATGDLDVDDGSSSSAARTSSSRTATASRRCIDAILNASVFRVNRAGAQRSPRDRERCCSTRARTSTRRTGTARRRSGPPSTCATSSSARRTRERSIRDEALALIERLLERRRESERAHARVSARAALHRRRSSAPSRGSISRARRRSCARPRPATSRVMRLLLEHGADPNIATDAGTTPLMVAAGVNWAVARDLRRRAEPRCSKP